MGMSTHVPDCAIATDKTADGVPAAHRSFPTLFTAGTSYVDAAYFYSNVATASWLVPTNAASP